MDQWSITGEPCVKYMPTSHTQTKTLKLVQIMKRDIVFILIFELHTDLANAL